MGTGNSGERQKILTKSKYLNGLQCLKYLWIAVNDPKRIPAPDEQDEFRFDEGHIVGEYSKKLFPDGIDLPSSPADFSKNLEETQKSLAIRKPLFEAGFLKERVYSRADILDPVKGSKDMWDIIEVKSSTEVKDVHIQDVAFQKFCYEKAGLKINKCFLMHINKEYAKKGNIKVDQLFVKEDISEKIEEEISNIPDRLGQMFKVMDCSEEPKSKIGEFCKDPYDCPIKSECWGFLPENSVFNLYRGGKRSLDLFEKGILAIRDIPEDYELGDKQKIQHFCAKTDKPHINKEAIKSFIKRLKYPLYFLDFETYQTVIPLYDGLKPYQQIPFQFSLHIVDKKGNKKHYSFVAEGNTDPRPEFFKQLKKKLAKKGSIIVYNQSFEQGRLKELAELFPKEKKTVEEYIKRMADLLVPFRNFDYYDCKQQGSASIKHVLPALTKVTYNGMDIANGGQASLRYLFITHGSNDGKKATKEEIKKVREDLEKYCCLDTEAMIMVMNKLKEVTKK
ncbi:hypothetical protein AUJ84_04120 [Candidatus Pacearchaeota archaeon CG1_02_32_132]|nr:MAG: hypothetical protein AUJ84_04120 [Candidatus Pacearchaeota archaeon CG1_02_32_132]